MHMDVVHDPERVKGYETLLARRHQDVCLRDPSKAKVSLSPNLGDLCRRRVVLGRTSIARTDSDLCRAIKSLPADSHHKWTTSCWRAASGEIDLDTNVCQDEFFLGCLWAMFLSSFAWSST